MRQSRMPLDGDRTGTVKAILHEDYFFILTEGKALICVDMRIHLPIFWFLPGRDQNRTSDASGSSREDHVEIADFDAQFTNANDVCIEVYVSDITRIRSKYFQKVLLDIRIDKIVFDFKAAEAFFALRSRKGVTNFSSFRFPVLLMTQIFSVLRSSTMASKSIDYNHLHLSLEALNIDQCCVLCLY